jgi:integration host factor subunit alpha
MSHKDHQQTLTRACLRDALHKQLNMSADTAHMVLESILDEVTNLIIRGDCVKIVGFGTFLVHEKKARMGRNPKTKEEAVISSRKSVSFRPAMQLRELVESKA